MMVKQEWNQSGDGLTTKKTRDDASPSPCFNAYPWTRKLASAVDKSLYERNTPVVVERRASEDEYQRYEKTPDETNHHGWFGTNLEKVILRRFPRISHGRSTLGRQEVRNHDMGNSWGWITA